MRNPLSRFALRSSLSFALSLVAVVALLSSAVPLVSSWTRPAKKNASKAATKQSAPFLNLQDSRELATVYSEANADRSAARAPETNAELLSGRADPLALASADLDADGFADLICGYAVQAGGALAVHRGNKEAFAPEERSDLAGIARGQFPDPFLKEARTISLPTSPDFIGTGDFNRDGTPDIAVASRTGNVLYVIPGDGHGGFNSPIQLQLPGVVTAMISGDINHRDGLTDLVLGVNSSDENAILVFDSPASILVQKPAKYSIPEEARSIVAGDLDGDRYGDLAVLSGAKVLVVHGSDSPDGDSRQIEAISFPFGVRAIALGDFVPDRFSKTEMALMSDDGALHIARLGPLDTSAMTVEQVREQRLKMTRLREKMKKAGVRSDAATIASIAKGSPEHWEVAEDLPSVGMLAAAARKSDRSRAVLLASKLSALPADDLLVLNPGTRELQVVYSEGGTQIQSVRRTPVPVDSDSDVVAVLPMRVNVDARPGLVMLKKGKGAPSVMMPMAATTYHVTRTDDPSPDGCAVGDCSLREAVIDSNANPGADTIVFDVNGTFTLSLDSGGSFENGATTGDLDINDSLSIVGNGPTNTVISTSFTSTCGDCKVFGVNQDGIFNSLAVSFSGLTIQNGVNNGTNIQGTFAETGGGVDFFMTGSGNSHSLTNCVVTNNSATGSFLSHGGGINVDSFNTATVGGPSAGTVSITDCTISNNTAEQEGGGINLAADLHDVNVTNCSVTTNQTTGSGGTSAGGGINIQHSFGGTVTISGGSATNNSAAGTGGGINITFNPNVNASGVTVSGNSSTPGGGDSSAGGGIAIDTTGVAGFTPTISITGAIVTGNHADSGSSAQGGGVYFNSFYDASLSNCSISGNTSGSGAGVFNGGSSATPQATLSLDGGSITGNAAAASGGGVGTLSANTSVTNCTITGNSAVTSGGGLFASGGTLTVSLSRIAGNTAPAGSGITQTSGTATVENNWWGCDGFPNAAGCQTGSGVFDADPRIDLRLLPTSVTLAPGGMQGFTADVSQNTNGATINPVVLNGLTITFGNTAGLGSVSPGSAVITSLTASTTFTANSSCPSPNTGTVSATLDNGTQTSSVTIQEAPAISACPANQVVSADLGQCSALVSFTAPAATAGCPTPTVTCQVGATTITSPHTFPVGFTTVTCTASNGISPDASCSFSVTVNDTQPPTIGPCPGNITTNENPAGSGSATVTYSTPSASDNCPGVMVNCNPPSGSSFPVGTTTVTCTATDASSNTASCQFTVTVNSQGLTALSPALVWIGLKNSDDVGTKFDLLAEVLKNGSVIGSGQINDVPGGSSAFNNAVLRSITLALGSSVSFGAGDTLSFRLSVRIAATSGHSSGTARLWYNGAAIDSGASRDAGSRFDATIGGTSSDYFLRTAFALSTAAGSSRTFVDKLVSKAGGNPFVSFGTWSITF